MPEPRLWLHALRRFDQAKGTLLFNKNGLATHVLRGLFICILRCLNRVGDDHHLRGDHVHHRLHYQWR